MCFIKTINLSKTQLHTLIEESDDGILRLMKTETVNIRDDINRVFTSSVSRSGISIDPDAIADLQR